jgi:hypothetical protein
MHPRHVGQTGPMGTAELLLVGVVLLAGLVCTLAPGLHGPMLCWAAVLWWTTGEHTALSWRILALATGILLLDLAARGLLPSRRLREGGISRGTLSVAGGAAIAGFFLIPVVGAAIGFVAGIYGVERHRLGSHSGAQASTRTAMRNVGLGVLIDLFACLLVTGAWLGAVLLG